MELNAQELRRDVLVVGASAGGIEPALHLLGSIPDGLELIVALVIHRGAFGGPSREGRASLLGDILGRRARRPVVEPLEYVSAVPGVIYLGPRDRHIVFEGDRVTSVRSAKQHFTRPAVDPLFISAAEAFGPRVMGVLLSGGGSDGVLGLIHVKARGGLGMVQSPAEAPHPSMPSTALCEDHVDAAVTLQELVRIVPVLAQGKRVVTNGISAAANARGAAYCPSPGGPPR